MTTTNSTNTTNINHLPTDYNHCQLMITTNSTNTTNINCELVITTDYSEYSDYSENSENSENSDYSIFTDNARIMTICRQATPSQCILRTIDTPNFYLNKTPN